MIQQTVRLKEAVLAGQSIQEFDPRSPAADDYRKLAEEVIRRSNKQEAGADDELAWLIQHVEPEHNLLPAFVEDVSPPSDSETAPVMAETPRQKVVLDFPNFHQRDLKIAGEFNDWIPDDGIETVRESGVVRKILHVAPGDYQYRLIIDGKWRNDPTNPHQILNSLGVHNSILHVEHQRTASHF
jgi:hypothetical protein